MQKPYSWSGWVSGEDCEPPEPGKEWLTIADSDDNEIAVIVLRTDAAIFTGDNYFSIITAKRNLTAARKMREDNAELIVAALNRFTLNEQAKVK